MGRLFVVCNPKVSVLVMLDFHEQQFEELCLLEIYVCSAGSTELSAKILRLGAAFNLVALYWVLRL